MRFTSELHGEYFSLFFLFSVSFYLIHICFLGHTTHISLSLFFRTYNNLHLPLHFLFPSGHTKLTSPFEFSIFFWTHYNSHLPLHSPFSSGHTTTHISPYILPVLQDTLQITSPFEFSLFFRTYYN